jgi:hypothetical protein
MNIKSWLEARRQRKAHARYLAEKARQEALRGQDAQDAVRDVAGASAGAQQGMYGQN